MTATHITAPDGSLWQLVPVEPTPEQIEAVAVANGGRLFNAHARAFYLAGLVAAPEFGGVAGPVMTPTFQEVWAKLQPVERAIISAQFMEPSRRAHPPAADEAMGRDSERLDFIERTFSGMTNRERYLPVQMIWGKGCNGRTLREACDKYMAREAAMRGGESGE